MHRSGWVCYPYVAVGPFLSFYGHMDHISFLLQLFCGTLFWFNFGTSQLEMPHLTAVETQDVTHVTFLFLFFFVFLCFSTFFLLLQCHLAVTIWCLMPNNFLQFEHFPLYLQKVPGLFQSSQWIGTSLLTWTLYSTSRLFNTWMIKSSSNMPMLRSLGLMQIDSKAEIQTSGSSEASHNLLFWNSDLSSNLIGTMFSAYFAVRCFHASTAFPFLQSLVLQQQTNWNVTLPSPLEVSIERTNSSNASLFFLQIKCWAFSAGLLRSNVSKSIGILTVPSKISLNPMHLALVSNLTSQNFQSSCLLLKMMTFRFFSSIKLMMDLGYLILGFLLIAGHNLGLCFTKQLALKHVGMLLAAMKLLVALDTLWLNSESLLCYWLIFLGFSISHALSLIPKICRY